MLWSLHLCSSSGSFCGGTGDGSFGFCKFLEIRRRKPLTTEVFYGKIFEISNSYFFIFIEIENFVHWVCLLHCGCCGKVLNILLSGYYNSVTKIAEEFIALLWLKHGTFVNIIFLEESSSDYFGSLCVEFHWHFLNFTFFQIYNKWNPNLLQSYVFNWIS